MPVHYRFSSDSAGMQRVELVVGPEERVGLVVGPEETVGLRVGTHLYGIYFYLIKGVP